MTAPETGATISPEAGTAAELAAANVLLGALDTFLPADAPPIAGFLADRAGRGGGAHPSSPGRGGAIAPLRPVLATAWGWRANADAAFPIGALDGGAGAVIPQRIAGSDDAALRWAALQRQLLAVLDAWRTTDPPEVEAALALLLRVAHAIAAPGDPLTSLADHARHGAAVAAIEGWHAAQGREGGAARARLVAVRTGGIQDFIFRTLPALDSDEGGERGRARTLRARSTLVALAGHFAARRVLQALALPSCNLLLEAGGRATLLVPAGGAADAVLRAVLGELEEWALAHVAGVLRLESWSGSDRPLADFAPDDPASRTPAGIPAASRNATAGALGAWRELAQRADAARGILRAPRLVHPDGRWREDGWLGDGPGLPMDRGAMLALLRQLGAVVPDARAITWDLPRRGLLDVPFDLFGFPLQLHPVPLHDAAPPPRAMALVSYAPGAGTAIDGRDWLRPVLSIATHIPRATAECRQALEARRDPELPEVGALLTFNHLAQLSQRSQRSTPPDAETIPHALLGILKADVDRLGYLAGGGLGAQPPFARLATMSRTLDTFFRDHLARRLREEWPRIYTLYAGGDDLFLVGPWYDVVRFAAPMRRAFRDAVAGNPHVTLSAGVALAKARTPVRELAQRGETALEGAKDAGRDRVSLGGLTVTWGQWDDALAVHAALLDALDQHWLARGNVYRLHQLTARALRVAAGDGALTRHDLTWRAHLAYDVRRNYARLPGEHPVRAAVAALRAPADAIPLRIATMLTLLVTRTR